MSRAIWLSLFGLTLWAFTFSVVYAMHGVGCENGWHTQTLLPGVSLHRTVMLTIWIAAIVIHIWSLRSPRFTKGPLGNLPRTGAWTGLGATVFTLAPIVLTGQC